MKRMEMNIKKCYECPACSHDYDDEGFDYFCCNYKKGNIIRVNPEKISKECPLPDVKEGDKNE